MVAEFNRFGLQFISSSSLLDFFRFKLPIQPFTGMVSLMLYLTSIKLAELTIKLNRSLTPAKFSVLAGIFY